MREGSLFLNRVMSDSVLRKRHWPEGLRCGEGERRREDAEDCMGEVGRQIVGTTLKVLIVSEGGET